ncbi:MAG: hypothetical protein V3U29_09250 [Phycisphaeraceae bacterium]
MSEPTMIEMLSVVQPWFENWGLVGTLLGVGVGLLGGAYGTVVGICAPRGKAKGLVYGLHWFSLLLGLAVLAAGVTALIGGQPYRVWYPLLLSGAIVTVLMIIFTPLIKLRYKQAEHRHLSAEEFRHG